MSEGIKKGGGPSDHPMRNLAEAAKLLAELRNADPLTALNDLGAWIETVRDISGDDEKSRGEALSLIQDASEPHLAALMGQFLGQPVGSQATRETKWNSVNDYLRGLTGALYATATRLLRQSAENAALQPAASATAARTLHACRLLAKSYLLHYMSVPPKVWRLAYGMYANADEAGCAATPVRMHGTHKTTTTANAELLRLLLLQSSAPDMLPPEQIEVADRVIEQLGGDFTLRPPGTADNPFLFHPGSDQPPQRAPSTPPPAEEGYRYFGAGAGYAALEKLKREFAKSAAEGATFGKDIPLHAQAAAIRHLVAFWGPANPYSAPARSPASGALKVVHGFAPAWQHVSSAGTGKLELSLVEEGDTPAVHAAAEPDWTLKDTGGNELGAEVPQAAADWARCGAVLAVSRQGEGGCSLGIIRSVHSEPEHPLRATIAILSSAPQAVRLMPHATKNDDAVYSPEAMRQFATFGGGVRAIILSDGTGAAAQNPNFMVPAEQWKEGRVYEATIGGKPRLLRSLQLLRRGDDFVRATFEWVEKV